MLAVISPVEGRAVDEAALLEWLRPRLAHFMIPRYIRIMPVLPKTPTQKVQKHILRAEGVSPDTWDRAAAGLEIRRDKLTSLGGAGDIAR